MRPLGNRLCYAKKVNIYNSRLPIRSTFRKYNITAFIIQCHDCRVMHYDKDTTSLYSCITFTLGIYNYIIIYYTVHDCAL